MSKIAELLGERIRLLRNQRGLSQEGLAYKASINTSYMGQVERGEKSPTIDTLEKIALALDVTLEELFRFNQQREQVDYTIMDKISFQLSGRPVTEQEAVYNLIKQILLFRDKGR